MPTLQQLQDKAMSGDSPLNAKAIDLAHGLNPTYLPDVSVPYFRIIYAFTWILGIIAFLTLIYGGMLYVTAGAEAEKAERGKKVILGAIIGLIVIFLSYAAYNTFIKGMSQSGNAIDKSGAESTQKIMESDPSK